MTNSEAVRRLAEIQWHVKEAHESSVRLRLDDNRPGNSSARAYIQVADSAISAACVAVMDACEANRRAAK